MASHLFIVGAAKSGTTSLYHYLSQHPQIFMSPMKEPHYFSRVTPDKQQARHVPTIVDESSYIRLFAGAGGVQYLGEASPSYLWEENTAQRIYDYAPDASIIIILRHPIERAYSHYLMDVREGRQKMPFYDALKTDFENKRKGWGVSHLYVELGLYCEQVKRYLEVFGKERVLILFFEDFMHSTSQTLEQICSFLTLEPIPTEILKTEKIHNPYAAPRSALHQILLGTTTIREFGSHLFPQKLRLFVRNRILLKRVEKPRMDDTARKFLASIYENEVRCLEHIIGYPVPWNF